MRRSARLSARRSIAPYVEEPPAEIIEPKDDVLVTPIVKNARSRPIGNSTARRKERLKKLAKTIIQTEESNADAAGSSENVENVISVNQSNESKEAKIIENDVPNYNEYNSQLIEASNDLLSLESNALTTERLQEQKEDIPQKDTSIKITDDKVAVSFEVLNREESTVPANMREIVPKAKKEQNFTNLKSKESQENKEKQLTVKSRRKYNFSRSSASDGNLLKLTKEVFKNLPFKLSKDDIFGIDSNKKAPKKELADIHKLDVISLDSSKKETCAKNQESNLSSELDPKINTKDLYFEIGSKIEMKEEKLSKENKVMKKSVLKSDFEKLESSPVANESMTQKMKNRKKNKGETAGPGWFNLPKTEVTDELKKDFQVIKMRNILDPKRYYKKTNKKMPLYFQVGTVVENATDFYSSRISKKERKRTMVDELLEDAEFRRKNKKKYVEIQKKKESGGRKYFKRMKNKKRSTWARD